VRLRTLQLHYGFQLPDAVFALDPESVVSSPAGLPGRVALVEGLGGFARTYADVALDVGSVRFGLWLAVPDEVAELAIAAWDTPDFADLRLEGTIANALPPWGESLLGARAVARASADPAADRPLVVGGDPVVESLLHQTWERAAIVAAIPAMGHGH
jgi:hypothetical protein